MTPVAAMLPCGRRLHLQHGPIDLILGAEGPGDTRHTAFAAAEARFATVLEELVAELELLRQPMRVDAPVPDGAIARRMDRATRPFAARFVTRMAAVAGAVADEILEAMCAAAAPERAYVNNGGDIALHLAPGQHFAMAMQDHQARDLGRISVSAGLGVGGVATSGRHGRSLSLGIADSVTVLARTAAEADAAATLIANAVDLPGHPAIRRERADRIDPDSDLGGRAVVTGCGRLDQAEITRAVEAGLGTARRMRDAGRIAAAAIFLAGEARFLGHNVTPIERSPAHA